MGVQRVAILGGGESGVGAALLAKKKGAEVFLSEYGKLKSNYRAELTAHQIPFEEEGHTVETIVKYDIVIKSPGISDETNVIKTLRSAGKEIISEIEYGFYFASAPIIGITGSNGKTTTTGLVYHLLKEAGEKVLVGGNIGKSFARLVAEDEPCEVYVLELSSFQLDGIIKFKPKIAILLNITPDHLDRYQYKFENYVLSKLRIAMNQERGDLFIYNGDDPSILEYFDFENSNQQLLAVRKDEYKTNLLSTDEGFTFDISETSLKGLHNRFNAVCAIKAVMSYGLNSSIVKKGLRTFKNASHRLELVDTVNGVQYINDSKATNVDAVYFALEAMDRPVIWIAGGTDKGNNYSPLMDLVKEKVKYLICMGVDNTKLLMTFSNVFDQIFETRSAQEAIILASKLATDGDVVLLSPACASFDLFRNYEDRGDQFTEAVKRLREQ